MKLEIYFFPPLSEHEKNFTIYLHLWFLRLLLYIVILKKFHFLGSNCLEHRQKRWDRASALQWDSCSLTEGNQQSLRERQGNTILLKSRGDATGSNYFLCYKAQRWNIFIFIFFFQCVWNQLIESRKHIESCNQTKWDNVLFDNLTSRFLEKALI